MKFIEYIKKVIIKPLDPFAWSDPLGLRKDGYLRIKAGNYEDLTGIYRGHRTIEKVVKDSLGNDKIEKKFEKIRYPWVELFLYSYDRSADVKFPLRQELHGHEWRINSSSDEDISKTSLRNSKGDFELEPNQFYMLANGEKLDLEKLNISSD